MELSNRRMDDADFDREFERIRNLWPTFGELDLDEMADYHRRVVGERTFAAAYRKPRAGKRVLLQPRFGVATVEAQAEGMRVLEQEGQADLLAMSSDTFSRWEEFGKAGDAVKKSYEAGRSLLGAAFENILMVFHFDWSPEGRSVAWVRRTNSLWCEIIRRDLSAGTESTILSDSTLKTSLSWLTNGMDRLPVIRR